MILKSIEFTNYAGEKETGNYYFNLSKGELVKMQMAAIDHRNESFQDKLEKIGTTLNGKALIEVIDEMIDNSFGVKTTDGKRFIKSPQDLEFFKSTDAYSELIVELCTSAEKCAEFVNGLVPSDLREEVNQEVAQAQKAKEARDRALAAKGGFNKKQDEPKSTVQTVPELPTVIEDTAPAVLEVPAEEPKKDPSTMTREELEAALAIRNG